VLRLKNCVLPARAYPAARRIARAACNKIRLDMGEEAAGDLQTRFQRRHELSHRLSESRRFCRVMADAEIVIPPHADCFRAKQKLTCFVEPLIHLGDITQHHDAINAFCLKAAQRDLEPIDVFVDVC
jgi:hypothetical protein